MVWRWRARLQVMLAVATLILVGLASAGGTSVLAQGGVTIYDLPGCVTITTLTDAKVTVPFSIGITGLRPFSTAVIFVTDKDANPEVVYGPIAIPNVDAQGNACIEVLDAPAGLWKVEVVEQGSGFSDSKVFTVEGEPEPTTTTTSTAPTTTTIPPTTTVPTTTVPTTTTTTSNPAANYDEHDVDHHAADHNHINVHDDDRVIDHNDDDPD